VRYRATEPSAYMNVSTLIFDLVDMVSKNGNFLLDIGPRADGSIVETEANTLREAGKWIHAHSEAIFNTTYWFVTPEVGAHIRFTQTNEAFYIFTFEKPANGTLSVEAPIPILEGDDITMLGSNSSMALQWSKDEDGYLTIDAPRTLVDSEDTCWVFKVAYGL
jgi:alpha-L-fucosidase